MANIELCIPNIPAGLFFNQELITEQLLPPEWPN